MSSSGQSGIADSPRGSSPTSRSLLERLKHQDNEAWREVVELYAPLVYFWCRKTTIADQDIPDVTQEVFRAVVKSIGTFRKDRPSDTFRGWLRTITRNKLNDYFRARLRIPVAQGGSEARQRLEQVPGEQVETIEEDNLAEQALFRRALERIRPQFDPKTWQAFWRVVVDGLSATEAARELGMRPGTVRVAKSRVLQRLRRQLGDVE